ncbi:C-X-C chemokine receptor type 1-like [Engraulis encrasicolus]|uniref:C-X-C chemokine receptor type 1-like n=1 Tax=Engraulis encrasicolus TaxID=184585 RepID=UPI002FD06915
MVAGLLIIFALSALSNALLMYIIAHFEKTKRALNLFFLCLAVFDFLFTLTLLFLAVEFLYHFNCVFGEAAFKIIKGAFFTGQSGGLVLLTAMTLDRFCTAVLNAWRPLTQTVSFARVLCVTTWIFSMAASLRYLLLPENYEYYSLYLPSGGLGYIMEDVFLFLIPLVIIVSCYRCILRTVLSMPHTRDRRRKLMLLFSHIAAFVVCFVPYNVLVCYKRFYGMSGCDANYEMLYLTSYILARSYCVVNPLLGLACSHTV